MLGTATSATARVWSAVIQSTPSHRREFAAQRPPVTPALGPHRPLVISFTGREPPRTSPGGHSRLLGDLSHDNLLSEGRAQARPSTLTSLVEHLPVSSCSRS